MFRACAALAQQQGSHHSCKIHCSHLHAQRQCCRNGFWGIFLLAAWPNALFDLCGICCGNFRTPFWVFFGATFCGKALVKVRCIHWFKCAASVLRKLSPDGSCLAGRPSSMPSEA